MIFFTDRDNFNKIPLVSDYPRLIIFLSSNFSDDAIFSEFKNNHDSDLDILALCKNKSVKDVIKEAWALENIEKNKQEQILILLLKENSERYSFTIRKEHELVDSIIDNPQENKWY